MKEAVIAVINYINIVIESQFDENPNSIRACKNIDLLNSNFKNDNLINKKIYPLGRVLSLNNLYCGINSPDKIKGKPILKAHDS